MWSPIYSLLFISFLLGCNGEYDLRIELFSYQVDDGLLANGSHCSPFEFSGVKCSISLKICIEVLSGSHTVDDRPDLCDSKADGFIQLGEVTESSNEIQFAHEGEYGAWINPHIVAIRLNETYKGFQLKLIAYHKAADNLIDSFIYKFDDRKMLENITVMNGSGSYSHNRIAGLSPTVLKLGWLVVDRSDRPTTTSTTTTTKAPATIYEDCEQVRSLLNSSGVYQVKLNDTVSVEVYCDVGRLSSLLVIQSRGEGDVSEFDNKTWDEYKDSFGTPGWNTNFWLGLENMGVLINSNKYGMAIEVCCGETPGTTTYYTSLKLEGVNDNYRLLGSSATSIGLNFYNDKKDLNATFSTFEKFTYSEVDLEFCEVVYYENEIKNSTGGWWFGNCANNLNGHYFAINDTASFQDASRCLLKLETIKNTGTGVEFKLDVQDLDTSDPFIFDRISWSRARMGLYKLSSGVPQDLNFCRAAP